MTAVILKIIACLAMLCDHIAVGMNRGGYLANAGFPCVYSVMRIIGRIAFPIFIFLMAEGAYHTKNKGKYLLRIGIFALISEIPFNILLGGEIFYLKGQNVFFTLFLGLLGAFAIVKARETRKRGIVCLVSIASIIGCVAVGEIFNTDYAGLGVLAVMTAALLSMLRDKIKPTKNERANLVIFSAISTSLLAFGYGDTETFALFALIPIALYNGEKGYSSKPLQIAFYVFYPVHILIIDILCHLCNLA